MEEITREIIEFSNERDWGRFHSPVNLAKSISIEAGELLECFQWDDKFDINDVKFELADVLTYCALMAEKLNLDIPTILHEKLALTRKKYPVVKRNEKSIDYSGGV